jgi:hypothetical protein
MFVQFYVLTCPYSARCLHLRKELSSIVRNMLTPVFIMYRGGGKRGVYCVMLRICDCAYVAHMQIIPTDFVNVILV